MKPNNTSNTPKPTFTHQLADEERSMPLGVGETSAEEPTMLDPLAGAGESRRFRGSSLLLVAVVVIACGGLWFMRTLSRVSGLSEARSDIEQTIDKYLDPKQRAGKQGDPNALEVISASYKDRQVPLESVKANPFILPGETESRNTVAVITGTDEKAVMARARAERQKDIDIAAERLIVKSIIMSGQPLANISGTIVREGDELMPDGSDVTFRVQSITRDTVTLVVEDLVLGMHVEVPLTMGRAK